MDQSPENFPSDYAKALADELLQAEKLSKNGWSDRKMLLETYRQLCFDFPRGFSSRSCLRLSQLLLREKTLLEDNQVDESSFSACILTDRFVCGLLQALNRVERPKDIPRLDGSSEARQEQPSLLALPPDTESDTDSALAMLGWTVFIRIPLKVLTSQNLDEASMFLGNFRGNAVDVNEPDSDDDDFKAPIAEGENHVSENGDGHHHVQTTGDMNEIWAEQSDDSDFEFESYRFQTHELPEDEKESLCLNEVDRVDSWGEVAKAISSLIQHCSWAKLSGLRMSLWQRHNISLQLTQIVLMLMQQQPSDFPLYQVFPCHYWQRLALYPIHFFRDATLLNTEQLLEDYLQLIAALIQSNTAKCDNQEKLLPSSALNPCTTLGISMLSALCGSLLAATKIDMHKTVHKKLQHLRLVQQSILDLSDELTLILEDSMRQLDPNSIDSPSPKQTTSDDATMTPTQAISIPWAFLSMWRVLVEATGLNGSLDAAQAQTLLNSGLFSKWLRWWEYVLRDARALTGRTAGAIEALRVVEETILDACLVSPKLLGKYAWRFPGFARRVCYLDDDLENGFSEIHSLVHLTLWNLLANELAATGATEPSIIWRKKVQATNATDTKDLSPPTLTMCQDTASRGFLLTCDKALETIIDWRRRRHGRLPITDDLAKQNDAVLSFVALIYRLAAIPRLLSASFTANLMADIASTDVSTIEGRAGTLKPNFFERFREVLSEWPSAHQPDVSIIKMKGDDTGASTQLTSEVLDMEGKKIDESPRKIRLQHQIIDESIQQLRRSLKVFQSVLESMSSVQISESGRIAMDNIGSKAD